MLPRLRAVARRVRATVAGARAAALRLGERSAVARFGIELGRRYARTNVSVLASSLAYRGFLFIVPVGLLAIAVAGYASSGGGDPAVEVEERMGLGRTVGSALSQAGADAADGWQLVLTVGLTGVLLGGFGLYTTLFKAYAQVWELPIAEVRSDLRTAARFVAGLLVFVAFLYGIGWVRRYGPILGAVGVAVSVATELALFVLMSMTLPNRASGWVQHLPGAVAGGAAMLGLQVVTAVWLPRRIESRSQTYGTVGVVIALLAYLALLGTVLLLVPLVNATWHELADERGADHPLRLTTRHR